MADITKAEFTKEFERRCSQMETAQDVRRVWEFMDKTMIELGWAEDRKLFLKLCRVETEWQTKKRITTHPESSNLWLGTSELVVKEPEGLFE